MRQTKVESFVETCLGTFIGFWVSWAAWPLAAWYFNIPFNHATQFGITAFFTVLSVARGYCVRRWCDKYLKQLSAQIALRVKRFL